MKSKYLSFGFAFYGLLLLGTAVFCFLVKSTQNAAWLFLAGMGIMTWSHFLNRKKYWGFTALLGQLFIMATALGWNILDYFRAQAGFERANLSTSGFLVLSAIFLITICLLILSTKSVASLKQELL